MSTLPSFTFPGFGCTFVHLHLTINNDVNHEEVSYAGLVGVPAVAVKAPREGHPWIELSRSLLYCTKPQSSDPYCAHPSKLTLSSSCHVSHFRSCCRVSVRHLGHLPPTLLPGHPMQRSSVALRCPPNVLAFLGNLPSSPDCLHGLGNTEAPLQLPLYKTAGTGSHPFPSWKVTERSCRRL